jgi:predicted O-methyltransferase YrrM
LRAYRYRDGLYGVDLLIAAVTHLNLFTWLAAHPSTKEQICAHYGFADRPVDVLLTLCAANGFVSRHAGGVFHTTDLGREHFADESPWSLRPYYAALQDRPIALDFVRVLETDRPAGWGGGKAQLDWHRAMETESFAASFTAAMDCRGRYLAQALAEALDLSGTRRLLDIGGGSGIYACACCARHPGLSGIVFEQPPVDRIARTCIADRGFTDRVAVSSGDMFTTALPADCDVHLFSNVLHDWGAAEVRALLTTSRRALPAGGLLVIHDAFINEDKTGPVAVAEYSTLLMHSSQGKCYSVGEYADLLRDAAFEPGPYRDTVADRGFMIATAV